MCTVILAHRVIDGSPVLLGANRDEQLDRPAAPPAIRDDGPLTTVSPRDLKAGGTWLGVNAAGVLSAITNRYGKPADPSRRSRGELVDRALAAASANAAATSIAELTAGDYNPFHLLCVDAQTAKLVWSDGERMSLVDVDPGLLVLTERSLGAAQNKRKERVLGQCRQLLSRGELDEAHLAEVLSQREPDSIDSTCVDMPSLNYGTRSSTIVRLGAQRRLLHADGAPCETDYRDLSELLDETVGQFGGQ